MVHPVTDRVGDALAVVGDRAGVEPPSPIAYEERDGVALDLCIEGDLRCARPLGRVDRRLPGGFEEGAQGVGEVAVADDNHFHGDAVIGLDLLLEDFDALAQRGGVLGDAARESALEQPGAQLALLGARQAHHLGRVLG